ncbi:MAG: prephenate dehydrogenase/arogenate dehydrogenase family protein, partial [Muribaculaceae bacterium]|nr:prephenate dehydrogenase/arogenate dehydrogenase family protein [Muribaculaceae bacterium]
LHVEEYTFEQHDETIAYSLSIPFASTLVFGSIMKHQDAPGTTFKRHMAIARGLMSEDDYLLSEILFNPHTSGQLDNIMDKLSELKSIIDSRDSAEMKRFLDRVRDNLR